MSNIKLNLTIEETNLVLEALGNLPYVRVFELVNKIQVQAQQQLNQNGEPAETESEVIGKTVVSKKSS